MKKMLVYYHNLNVSGGVERVISNLVNNLSDYIEVTVLTKSDEPSFYKINDNVRIDTLNVPLKLNMNNRISRIYNVFINLCKSTFKLKKYLYDKSFDCIYVATPQSSLELFLQGKKVFDKVIITEHASKDSFNSIYSLFKKLTYPRAKRIVVPTSTDTKNYLDEGINAVYIKHLNPFSTIEHEESKIVLSVGRLTDDKQHSHLIEIWKNIVSNNNQLGWKLRIVGEGENKNQLEELISKYSLQNHVELYGQTKEIDKIYKDAGIFAFTSRNEGFGMVLLEAMSFELPCISYDCPVGPKDIIVDGKTGYLIELNNLYEFEKKLLDLMTDDSLRYQMKSNCVDFVQEWDNSKIINQWIDLISKY